jgi:hemoglobin
MVRKYTLAMTLSLGLVGCTFQAELPESSLYSRLGAKPGITAIVDEFVVQVANDPRVNNYFESTISDAARNTRFRKALVNQFCESAGGPCKHKGPDPILVNQDVALGNQDFDSMVEDLNRALDKFEVGDQERREIGALLLERRYRVVTD